MSGRRSNTRSGPSSSPSIPSLSPNLYVSHRFRFDFVHKYGDGSYSVDITSAMLCGVISTGVVTADRSAQLFDQVKICSIEVWSTIARDLNHFIWCELKDPATGKMATTDFNHPYVSFPRKGGKLGIWHDGMASNFESPPLFRVSVNERKPLPNYAPSGMATFTLDIVMKFGVSFGRAIHDRMFSYAKSHCGSVHTLPLDNLAGGGDPLLRRGRWSQDHALGIEARKQDIV